MSIPKAVKDAVHAGKLREWIPSGRDPDESPRRRLFFTEEAWQACPPKDLTPTGVQLDKLARANALDTLEDYCTALDFEAWVDIKPLKPSTDEIWEIRVRCRPAARFFGWFVAKNVFVVTHLEPRARLNFAKEIEKAMTKRSKQFSDLPILRCGHQLAEESPLDFYFA